MAGVAILISDKIDFKTNATTKDNEGRYIIFEGLVQQEDVTNKHICTQYKCT